MSLYLSQNKWLKYYLNIWIQIIYVCVCVCVCVCVFVCVCILICLYLELYTVIIHMLSYVICVIKKHLDNIWISLINSSDQAKAGRNNVN